MRFQKGKKNPLTLITLALLLLPTKIFAAAGDFAANYCAAT